MINIDSMYKKAINHLINKGVTAYELHNFSGQSEAGLRKVLTGKVENPRRKTKEIIISYYNYLLEKDKIIKGINNEYTEGLEKHTPHQIATYISNNIELFRTEELMQLIFEKSVLEEANKLVDKKLKETKPKN